MPLRLVIAPRRTLSLLCLALVASCAGPTGPAGSKGSDGAASLIRVTAEAAGTNCTSGGHAVATGADDNHDGTLQDAEVDSTVYLCDGTAGLSSLIKTTVEPAGANCASGGKKIESGVDKNADGSLSATEVDATTYVCDGTKGLSSLMRVSVELGGANCVNGGQKIESGVDDNGDGSLAPAEVDSVTYVCNGPSGLGSLLKVSVELAGVNCASGGQKVESGVDDNGDGVLQAGEVDATTYVCNGSSGSLLTVTPEPAGLNCLNGGQRIDNGVDDNRDGVLQSGEIDQTTYLCARDPSRLLIVSGDATGGFSTCVVAGLTPFFGAVDVVAGVPTATDLATHDAVLVYNNGSHTNPAGLGDALADFFDQKGHVVEALYGTGALGSMTGRWGTGNYRVLSGNYATTSQTMGTVAEPTSPLMFGVTTFAVTRSVTGSAVNGGIVVTSYNNGQPMIVRGVKNGRNRVDLGMFPGGCSGSYWTGDGFRVMQNALKF